MTVTNIDIFGQVKNQLDIVSIMEYYGAQLDNKGYANCPFHDEKTPSFKVFPTDNSFYCFGCGVGGTVIDFVMKLFNITNIEAAKQLNADFNLRTNTVRPYSKQKIQEDKKLINDFTEWEKQAFRAVSGYYRALKFWGEQIFINKVKYFEQYLPDIENIVFVEVLLDLMIVGDAPLRVPNDPNTWETPVPFDSVKIPEFPVNELPVIISDYVRAVAESAQVSPDMAAVASLATLALCLQGKYFIYRAREKSVSAHRRR